jgi:tRNA(Ile)-lysidine synthase
LNDCDLTSAVAADGLIASGRRLVVLYSGGRDSTCLLDVAVRIAGSGPVRALHVNYGLRVGAGDDEAHCGEVCAALGVPLTVHRPGPAPARGNLQAWARDERYGAARRLAGAAGGPRGPAAQLAAGHTATDQVETILYRLASSPSRRALLGMRPRDGDLIRPLLAFTRAQTTAHCRARGLAWREDETNAGDDYARNRVRHGLVPALQRVHPAAADNVLALAEVLAGEAAVLDELVDEILDGERTEVAVTTLRAQPPALRRLLVQRLADAAAGEPAAGVARRAQEIAALPQRGAADLHLPHGVRARARGGIIRFDRTPSVRAPRPEVP